MADIAHAGNFARLRELDENGMVSLADYPNVAGWMERIEARESFELAGQVAGNFSQSTFLMVRRCV